MIIKHKDVSELTEEEIRELRKQMDEIRKKDRIKTYWKEYSKEKKRKLKEKLRPPSLF